MPESGLYSHPGILLEEHINNALTILSFLKKENIPLWNDNIELTLKVSLALHDFGKATIYFQRKVKGEKLKPQEKQLSNHSLISAIYTFYKLQKIFSNLKYPLMGFFTVLNHHSGFLKDFSDSLVLSNKKINLLKEQTKSIDQGKINLFIENLKLESKIKENLKFNKTEFLDFLNKVQDIFDEIEEDLDKVFSESSLKEFLELIHLFSLLVDSDKTEAGSKKVPSFLDGSLELSPQLVEEFKRTLKRKRNSTINELREIAFQEIKSAEVDLNNHFYTLTLPTGLGKTLIGTYIALKLKLLLEKQVKKPAKFIYSLPFLSIIDQNAEVLNKTFKPLNSRILIKHHHLSLGELLQNEEDYEKSRLLVEAWNAPVIITTFVQFFESLIPFKNSSARRHNKLANSVVLIDEVQALPSKYWFLLREYLKEFAKQNNTYFVFMTATQPYLVEKGKELIPNKEFFFSKVNRYKVEIQLQEQTLEEFFNTFEPENGKSYLFIFNTIKSSKRAYELLKNKGLCDNEICYLSTSLTPFDRKKRIEELKKGEYKFAVTTQLVEAGVDIDFSTVIRDFAPLDSLIQSAGRCNRNSNFCKGEFIILNLINEKGRKYSSYIYEPLLLQITEELLKLFFPKNESELIQLSEPYYRKIWNQKSKDLSRNLLKAVKELKFSRLREFKLVENEPYKVDVFVQENTQAVEIWNKTKQILEDLRRKKINLWEARKKFETIKSSFYNFVISVDVRDNTPPKDEILNIYYIPHEEIDKYYDPQTGFKEKGTVFEFF